MTYDLTPLLYYPRFSLSSEVISEPLSSKIIINKYHILSLLLLLFSYEVMSDSETPWTVVCQAPLSMGFPRQEYWSGLPFPSPVDLPEPGIEPGSPALQADSLPSEPLGQLYGKL